MPLIKKHTFPLEIIALWHITETPEQLQSMLTIDEFVPFKAERRNTHWLAARLALQGAVGNSSSKIIKNDHGKPFLNQEDGHISISHSGNLAAAIFNSKLSCGIDLELYDSRIERISHKFTNEDELSLFPKHFLNSSACLIWSAKESVFKYTHLHDVFFKEQIQLKSIDLKNETLHFHFKHPSSEEFLEVHYKVFEMKGKHLAETQLLADEEMSFNERYILTWI